MNIIVIEGFCDLTVDKFFQDMFCRSHAHSIFISCTKNSKEKIKSKARTPDDQEKLDWHKFQLLKPVTVVMKLKIKAKS
jgi:hypothetical protein